MKLEIAVSLTEEQLGVLACLYDKARSAREKGKPGIILAQCTTDGELFAAFVSHDLAKQITSILDTKQTRLV